MSIKTQVSNVEKLEKYGIDVCSKKFLSLLCPDILNELLQRENRVLHFWTMRKRRLDQCQQYVVFERSAKQVHGAHPETRTGNLDRKGTVYWRERIDANMVETRE